MALNLVNLDDRTRALMRAEVERDTEGGSLYLGRRLSNQGRKDYPDLLLEAIANGDDDTLATALRVPGRLVEYETRTREDGRTINAKVPVTAAATLAEGEFNRFYARALCLRALEDGIPNVQVYRAKEVGNPRPESKALLGSSMDPLELLNDLRTHQGVDTALHLPPGPNSGLSVRLP
jgi:hypothetical protein